MESRVFALRVVPLVVARPLGLELPPEGLVRLVEARLVEVPARPVERLEALVPLAEVPGLRVALAERPEGPERPAEALVAGPVVRVEPLEEPAELAEARVAGVVDPGRTDVVGSGPAGGNHRVAPAHRVSW